MHNHHKLVEKMRAKGWSNEEIAHAKIIMGEHTLKHHIIHPAYDKILHWLIFICIIFVSTSILILLIPIMALDERIAYTFAGVLALAMGTAFDKVLKDYTSLKNHHYVLYAIIIPIIIASSTYFIATTAWGRSAIVEKEHTLGIIYAICFIIPYYIRLITSLKK